MTSRQTTTNERKTIEWPTLGVMLICYGFFITATVYVPVISPLAATILLALAVTLHSSLQHEVLHGHPFPQKWLSELLVFPAIGLFIPYIRFRDTHLAHHQDPNLTDPFDDPESNYLEPTHWEQCGTVHRAILRFNNTLLGRMLIGPLIGTVAFWIGDIRLIMQGDMAVIRAYIMHVIGLLLVLYWIANIGELSVWLYFLAAYSGLALLKIRTFMEHRAHDSVPGRTVIIEDKGLLSFLFLNNNYHSVHHAHPQMPWYVLPGFYAARRASYLQRNRDYYYSNYAQVFRKHFLWAKDPVPHPLMPVNAKPSLKPENKSDAIQPSYVQPTSVE